MSKESPSRPQRGPRLPQPNRTYHQDQDQDQDLPQSFLPDVNKEPVAGRARCRQTVDMFQQPGLATYLRSARQTCSQPCCFVALFCVNYCPTVNYPGSNWWTSAQARDHQYRLNYEHTRNYHAMQPHHRMQQKQLEHTTEHVNQQVKQQQQPQQMHQQGVQDMRRSKKRVRVHAMTHELRRKSPDNQFAN